MYILFHIRHALFHIINTFFSYNVHIISSKAALFHIINRLFHIMYILFHTRHALLLRLPVARGEVINSPRSIFLGVFLVSKVGLPLMGGTAGTKLREPIETQRLTAEYVNKTCILTCILQYLNCKKVLHAKILMQNVL